MPDTSAIAQLVQLAIAPVFLIAGIGALLNVMTSRLARVIDRVRELEMDLLEHGDSPMREDQLATLKYLDRRMVRINWAITFSTIAALLVCLMIVTLFLGEFVHLNVGQLVAGVFIATMVVLILGLCFFLAEISIATRTLRVSTIYRSR